ncbi:MAG: DUF6044 family protein [Lachnospiraceae bacterium]|nr:DUF6044 family protein [Lachnospiraceae bacterium]
MTETNEKKKTKEKNNIVLITVGCVLCILSMLPFFIMGEDSIISYNDQLDGELLTYILNAKHLFEGLDTYSELMNGIPAAGMVSPAPLFVLLFKVFPPFVCLMIMTLSSRLSGFLSVYFLCRECTRKNLIAFFAGMAFMMMPFYPVYGLCIPGQAFVWLSLILLSKENTRMRYMLISYTLIILYAATSSVALVGFGIIIVFAVYAFVLAFRSRVRAFRVAVACILLIVTYTLCNMPLVRQLVGLGYDFVSHKSEVLIVGNTVIEMLKTYILGRDLYTWCAQSIIAVFSVISLIAAFILSSEKKHFFKENRAIFNTLGFIAAVIFLIVLYSLPVTVDLRNNAKGVLHDFSFIRISWMLPVAWILLFSQCASALIDRFKENKKKALRIAAYSICIAVSLVIFGVSGFRSDSKTTVMRMIKGKEYKQISYRQFYSEDLFDKVEEMIGRDRSDFSVISMGLTPASAAYNGFNCLDAYSNNYDVEYKHEFRKIMEKELAKSDYYTSYYDDWGNRCYIYLSAYKTGINAYFYNITFNDIEIDFSKAGEMGADYVISASPIAGWEEMGIRLLNENPISSPDCWYELYVYEIL